MLHEIIKVDTLNCNGNILELFVDDTNTVIAIFDCNTQDFLTRASVGSYVSRCIRARGYRRSLLPIDATEYLFPQKRGCWYGEW